MNIINFYICLICGYKKCAFSSYWEFFLTCVKSSVIPQTSDISIICGHVRNANFQALQQIYWIRIFGDGGPIHIPKGLLHTLKFEEFTSSSLKFSFRENFHFFSQAPGNTTNQRSLFKLCFKHLKINVSIKIIMKEWIKNAVLDI